MQRWMRKLAGIGTRLADAAAAPGDRLRRALRDPAYADAMRLTEGGIGPSARIAVFVLFQPAGISAATLATCRHLTAQGFATLAISNAPISPADRDRIAPEVWRLAERPNWGYDFGAYRDGLWLIRDWALDPAQVLLVNDSIFFPLRTDDRLIARVAALDCPFAGASWDEKPGRAHRAHLQSFFLLLGQPLLRDAAFQDFWHRYPMSDRRGNVLRRGEKGLSAAVRAAGHATGHLMSRQRLIAHLRAAPNEDLCAWADLAARWRPETARMLRETAGGGLREAMVADLARGHFLEAYVGATAAAFGLSFLKKRNDASGVAARRQYLDGVRSGLIPPPDAILLEEIGKSVHDASP